MVWFAMKGILQYSKIYKTTEAWHHCYVAFVFVCSDICLQIWVWPPQIAKFMGPTWGPPGSCRPQMGPMLAPWTLLSGTAYIRQYSTHYHGVAWAAWWLKSPGSRMFLQPVTKGNFKNPYCWSCVRESTGERWIPIARSVMKASCDPVIWYVNYISQIGYTKYFQLLSKLYFMGFSIMSANPTYIITYTLNWYWYLFPRP